MLAVLGISALRTLGQSSTVIFLPVFLRDDLGFSLARVAIYLSMSQLAGIGAQPFMGALSDRLGRKAVLVPALTAFGMLLIALKFVPTGFLLVVVIVAMGAFLYSLQALFLAAASDMGGPEVQATTASLVYGSTFLSSTISPLLAGMVADALGIRSAFLYGAAMLLLASVAMSFLKLPGPADRGVAGGG
jgi:MFS family permease